MAKDVSPHQICALLRWRSTKSLAAYAALNARAYTELVERAQSATIDSIRAANLEQLPITTPEEVALNFSQGHRAGLAAAARTEDELAQDAYDDSD